MMREKMLVPVIPLPVMAAIADSKRDSAYESYSPVV